MTAEEFYKKYLFIGKDNAIGEDETILLNKAIKMAELYHQAKLKSLGIANVVKSLPTDECVEQWWAEGQDQNKNFWHEAPYRTNGDVVEEIKAALKYFIERWQR